MPPDPDIEMPFRHLLLSFAPEGLDDPPDVAAPTRHLIAPVPAGSADPPPWLDELDDRPLVYATLGTVYNGLPGLLAAIVDGLGTEPVHVVVAAGRDQDPDSFGRQPPSVRIERWVPQHAVMPRAALVVSHGGFGTLSAAMALGIPQVLMPISADQPMNAARCRELGVGVVIGPHERAPDAVRAAARQVLGDDRYALAARQLTRATSARPGLDHALDLLETLAHDRRPGLGGA